MLNSKFDSGFFYGVLFIAVVSATAVFLSNMAIFSAWHISPLVIGIVLGMLIANIYPKMISDSWNDGILFCAKRILRIAIIFYGFRITFQQVVGVGLDGILVSSIMLTSTFLIGSLVGVYIFKMPQRLAILTGAGAAVCGAAAVLATEPVVKAKPHESTIAVAQVVLFGTIAMFLYPVMYATGWFGLDEQQFGIYIGGTIHEVAQVLATGSAISAETEEVAVIVKMTRVILIAPALIILGIFLSWQVSRKNSEKSGGKLKLVIPWFAVIFLLVIGFNSMNFLEDNIVNKINTADTFLLTMAMTALGTETRLKCFKQVGLAPFYTALIMFIWLIFAGAVLVWLI